MPRSAIDVIYTAVEDPNRPDRLANHWNELVPGDAHRLRISAKIASTVPRLELAFEVFACKFSWGHGTQLVPLGVSGKRIVLYDPADPIVFIDLHPVPSEIHPSDHPINAGFKPGTGTHAVRITLTPIPTGTTDPDIDYRPITVDHQFLFDYVYPPEPVGSVALTQIWLNSDPSPPQAAPKLEFSDGWGSAFLSVNFEATGFSPRPDATVLIDAALLLQEGPVFDGLVFGAQEFQLSAGSAILGCDSVPLFPIGGTVALVVNATCEGRHNSIKLPIQFIPGNRPDRLPSLKAFSVSQNNGISGHVIHANGGPVTAHLGFETTYIATGCRLDVGIQLARKKTEDGGFTPTQMLSFGTMTTRGEANESLSFELGNLTNDAAAEAELYPLIHLAFQSSDSKLKSSEWIQANTVQVTATSIPLLSAERLIDFVSQNPANYSGPQWCARYPGSRSLDDLVEPFRSNARAFINMLSNNGASVLINATLRPPERAYLMHYSFEIARRGADPSMIPSMGGVDILWDHPTYSESVEAAAEMVDVYQIVYEPALNSGHTRGRAMDVTITNLPQKLRVSGANGQVEIDISGPSDGASNLKLRTVAASYFHVFKNPNDPPHWYG